jgi:hypothetical protein
MAVNSIPRHCVETCNSGLGHCRISRWSSNSRFVQPTFAGSHLERIPSKISPDHDVLHSTIPARRRRIPLVLSRQHRCEEGDIWILQELQFQSPRGVDSHQFPPPRKSSQSSQECKKFHLIFQNSVIPYFTIYYFQILYLIHLLFYECRS